MNKFKLSLFLSLMVLILMIVFQTKNEDIKIQDLTGVKKILAFGDSLTYGKGAPSQSYPLQLQKLLSLEVINAGKSGESSSQGLNRLPSLLKNHKPDLVILCHGGNDLMQQTSKEVLKSNLVKMIKLSKESGARVLLVGVPNFKLIRFSTESLYKEVAEQENIMYEGDVLSYIENDRSLKSDRIHPNAKGYMLMAKAFSELIN
ncbi:MAG TPA: arylesterase [Sulfurimonas sp.]|nr:arylesterase [Sulfurimonas sp.]